LTDYDRISSRELIYTGVRRTPVCAILGWNGAAELFATTLDVYLTLGMIPEDPADTDTADGRPATRSYARARLCRMMGGDTDMVPEEITTSIAEGIFQQQCDRLQHAEGYAAARLKRVARDQTLTAALILSGSGEFLARHAFRWHHETGDRSLTDTLGPA